MEKTISPRMQKAIDHMKRHDNTMVRYPGGYWAAKEWHMWAGPSFGTSTIEALVSRGIAEYTVWKEVWGGKFPLECKLVSTDKTS